MVEGVYEKHFQGGHKEVLGRRMQRDCGRGKMEYLVGITLIFNKERKGNSGGIQEVSEWEETRGGESE